MSTRISINLMHHARILPLIALCTLVAVNVFADGRSDRSRNDDSNKRDIPRHERSNKDSKDQRTDKQRNEHKDGINQKPVYGSFNPNRRDKWDSSNKSSSDNRKNSTYKSSSDNGRYSTYKPSSDNSRNSAYKSTDNSRSRQRPDAANTRSDDWRNKRDNQDYRSNSGIRVDIDIRNNRDSDKKQDYTFSRTRGNDNHHPRSYKPPVYRGGYYYYYSHPSHKPCHYGYWELDNYDSRYSRRSIYFHYGFFRYVLISRIHITPYISIAYYDRPISYDNDYYLTKRNNVGLNDALSDIRLAWVNSRSDLLDSHVNYNQRIAILLDGKYDYSIDSDDYTQMTFDAIDEIQTVSFTWMNIRQHINGDFTAFGKHNYYDSSSNMQTTYVSYTLSKIGRDYIITEVGSSTSPLI